MLKIKQAIIVEGRYDKSALAGYIEGVIVQTNGFQIFSDRNKLSMIRRLAETCGIVILTDSDASGFLIRNRLKSMIPSGQVLNAYIPDIYGKETRKDSPSAEGKLGVEAMDEETLVAALKNAGADFHDQKEKSKPGQVTKAELYADGLCGSAGSAARRAALLKKLSLPEHMSTNALTDYINLMYTYEEYKQLVNGL